MADIPGIIEGAHEGKGLGLRFLKHIERNSSLLFMVSCEARDIFSEYKILLNELKSFSPELLDKKRILAITKCDLLDDELEQALEKELKLKMRGRNRIPVVFISAQTQHRIQELKDLIWKQIND